MKKYFLFLFFAICSFIAHAQVVVDCNSGRYDHEVFSSVNMTSDITYGSNLDYNSIDTTLTMDIYQPAGDTAAFRPLIIWAHGGSFVSGTKNDVDVDSLSVHFAKRGYVCVSINYRLGISFPYNQASATAAVWRSMQDMKAAVRYFRQDAATPNTYHIDPNLIFAGGTSAGAFAALHLAYLDQVNEIPASIDTTALGNIEGNSGNPGYSSSVNAVINLCGALGSKTYIQPGNIPFVSMHGNADQTVPYATDEIYLLGVFPIMIVDGSYSIAGYADSIGVYNQMYTFFGADHVPFVSSIEYMDTTVRFVSNFLFEYLNCTPSDPNPQPNTFNQINSVENISKNNIHIYPNPSTSGFHIQFDENDKSKKDVFVNDISGKVISEFETNSSVIYIPGGKLNQGIYFVKIISEGKIYFEKIVVN